MAVKKPKGSKGAYHHGNLRSTLIEKALGMIERRDGVSFTLREIAVQAGVSHAAAYRHFSDKRELLGAIAEDGFRAMAAKFAAELRTSADLGHSVQLHRLGMAYIQFALDNPGHFRAMFHSDLSDRDPFPKLQLAAKEAFGALRTTIEAGILAGAFRAGAGETAALAAWSLVHGFASLALEQHVPTGGAAAGVTRNQWASAIIDLFEEGLLAKRPADLA